MPPGHMKKAPHVKRIRSKTQISKVMFLAAIARPRPDKNFSGKIGIWRIAEPYKAQRDSKYHEKGEVYSKDVKMDRYSQCCFYYCCSQHCLLQCQVCEHDVQGGD